MTVWIEAELKMLRGCYPELDFVEAGLWARIPRYSVSGEHWNIQEVDVSFQFPESLPGQAPYGFYVRPDMLLSSGERPGNYQYPATTPWGQDWGKFSWQPEVWIPGDTPPTGSNMLGFVRSFSERFREGR